MLIRIELNLILIYNHFIFPGICINNYNYKMLLYQYEFLMFDLNINLEFLQHCPTFKKSSSRLYWYKRINFIWPKSVHKMPPCDIKLEKSQTFVCQCSLFSCSHKNFFKFIYIIENRSTKFNIILSLCIWCISVHLTYIDCNNFSMIARTLLTAQSIYH